MDNQQEQQQSSVDQAKEQIISSLKTTWNTVKTAKKLAKTAKKIWGAAKLAGKAVFSVLTGGTGALALLAKEASIKLGKWALHKAGDAIKGLLSLGWLTQQRAPAAEEKKPWWKKHELALIIACLLAFVVLLPFVPLLVTLPKMAALVTSSPN